MAHGPEPTTGASGAFRAASFRGEPGFYRVAQHVAGHWWMLDPADRPVFLRAVHGVSDGPSALDGAPLAASAVRLRGWGFNAVGTGSDGAGRGDGMPFLALVDFAAGANLITTAGVRLPDVFDPDWPAQATRRAAEVCTPEARNPALIGWVTDDPLAWGPAAGDGRPTLLQICLSLEPAFPAYHAAWEFVLALHRGSLEDVAAAWDFPLANKEVVREATRADQAIGTRGYAKDDARWTREFARRYFGTVAAAVRSADSAHLLCGARSTGAVSPHVLAAAAYPVIDVPLVGWTELPVGASVVGPVIASDVDWTARAFRGEPLPAGRVRGARRLSSVERMLRRGRAALQRLARHPLVVGYAWGRWVDEPGEQPPFAAGLVHRTGAEAVEHTELLADFNGRAEALRRSATKQLSP